MYAVAPGTTISLGKRGRCGVVASQQLCGRHTAISRPRSLICGFCSGRADVPSTPLAGALPERRGFDKCARPWHSPGSDAVRQRASNLGSRWRRLGLSFEAASQLCALLGLACVAAVLVPAISRNCSLLAEGNLQPVADEAWQELLQDVFAFTGLTSVFVGLQEAGSSLAHATGACLYSVVFLQMVVAGGAPSSIGVGVAAVTGLACVANTAKALSWLEGPHRGLWTVWTDALAIIGWSLLPFLFCHNFLGGGTSAGPSLALGGAAAALVACKRAGGLHREAAGFWDRNGLALAATATFMMEGVAELVKLLQDASGYLPAQVTLNTAFVALLIPRSLFTQDSMFFIDITWNALLGWGQLLVLFSLRHSLSGHAHLSAPTFGLLTVSFLALLWASLQTAAIQRPWNNGDEGLPARAEVLHASRSPLWLPAVCLVQFPFQQLARFARWLRPSWGTVLFRLPARQRHAALQQRWNRRKQAVAGIKGGK